MSEERKNRLNSVFFCTGSEWESSQKQLSNVLGQKKISCCHLEAAAEDDQLDWERMKEGILITDQRETAKMAAANGIICIGLEKKMNGFFTGAVLVCDTLDSLDVEVLEETFLHEKGLPVQIANTERLLIREIAEQDIDTLCRISCMEGMEYLMPEGKCAADFFQRENLKAYISTVYRFYGYGLWSVLKKDGTLIGCCGFQDDIQGDICEDAGSCLELQYMLSPEYWGQGYGTEMCRAATGFVFARTDAQMLCVRCHPENTAAIVLAEKLGFLHEKGNKMIKKLN